MRKKKQKQTGMYQEVRNVVTKMAGALENNKYGNESTVADVIKILLRKLGWSSLSGDIKPEERAEKGKKGGMVDIVLCEGNKKHRVYIEVKSVGMLKSKSKKHEAENQLFRYAAGSQTPTFLVLTDAREWIFYYFLTEGERAEKIYLQLSISKDKENIDKCVKNFCKYLSRKSVTSGRAGFQARKHLEGKRKAEELQSLKEAWAKLLEDPPLQLGNLIKKKAGRDFSGIVIKEFLSEQAKKIQKRVGRTSLAPLQTNVENANLVKKNTQSREKREPVQFWYSHLLKALNKLNGSAKKEMVLNYLSKDFSLHSTDRTRIDRAKRNLREMGYIAEQKNVGIWELTDKGKEAAERGVEIFEPPKSGGAAV